MRVLFAIGGFGLGNSTRCASLIESLHARGFEIDVATSSNGLWYFSESRFVRKLEPLVPLAYAGNKGAISILRTLAKAPRLGVSLITNAARILKLHKKNQYSFVVVDSEYSCFLVKELLGVPVVAVNNVFFTRSVAGRKPPRGWERLHGWVESLDLLIQTFRSDLRIAPVLDPRKVGEETSVLFCPPLVQSGVRRLAPPRGFLKALVIASGSGLGVSRETVGILSSSPEVASIRVLGLDGPSRGKVTYLGRRRDTLAELGDADFVVTNAGFSALSEAVISGRPLISLPIRNHFEQRVNAGFMQSIGAGVVSSEETLLADLASLAESLRKTDRATPVRARFEREGPDMAADFICKFAIS